MAIIEAMFWIVQHPLLLALISAAIITGIAVSVTKKEGIWFIPPAVGVGSVSIYFGLSFLARLVAGSRYWFSGGLKFFLVFMLHIWAVVLPIILTWALLRIYYNDGNMKMLALMRLLFSIFIILFLFLGIPLFFIGSMGA